MNILRALNDRKVFGPFFHGDTWGAWRVFLAALFALPLTPEQLALYQHHTGRSTPPAQPSHEAWLVCGRRSRQDLCASLPRGLPRRVPGLASVPRAG